MVEEPTLQVFVFFTNIDMTPGQQKELVTIARDKGIDILDLYWRERIRLLLDSPEGYGIRLSFLDIPLSDAEQKVFFSKFGKDLHKLITGRLDSVEERIEELHFANWKQGKCQAITVRVKLKKVYEPKGAKHFPYRFMLRLQRVLMHGPGEILLGCYSTIEQLGDCVKFDEETFLKIEDSDLFPPKLHKCNWLNRIKKRGVQIQMIGNLFSEISFGCTLGTGRDDGVSLRGLSEYAIDFYCDDAWADLIHCVEVWYDDYLIQEYVNRAEARTEIRYTIPGWPDEEAKEVSERPYQYWRGWIMNFDRLCKRKRLPQFRN